MDSSLNQDRHLLLQFAMEAMGEYGLDQYCQMMINFKDTYNTITFLPKKDLGAEIVIGIYPSAQAHRFEVGVNSFKQAKFRTNLDWERTQTRFWELVKEVFGVTKESLISQPPQASV